MVDVVKPSVSVVSRSVPIVPRYVGSIQPRYSGSIQPRYSGSIQPPSAMFMNRPVVSASNFTATTKEPTMISSKKSPTESLTKRPMYNFNEVHMKRATFHLQKAHGSQNLPPVVLNVPSVERPFQIFQVTDDQKITKPVVQIFVPENFELNFQKSVPFCGTGPKGPQKTPFDPYAGLPPMNVERKVDPETGKIFYEIPMIETKNTIVPTTLGAKKALPEYRYHLPGTLSLKNTTQGIAEGGCVIPANAQVTFRVRDDHGGVLTGNMVLAVKK